MRDKPLKLNAHQNGNGKWKIKGLDRLGPFGSVRWGSFDVYTTPHLRGGKFKQPRHYILNYYGKKNIIYDLVGGGATCLGELYNLMSDEEKRLFENDIEEIMEILGTE